MPRQCLKKSLSRVTSKKILRQSASVAGGTPKQIEAPWRVLLFHGGYGRQTMPIIFLWKLIWAGGWTPKLMRFWHCCWPFLKITFFLNRPWSPELGSSWLRLKHPALWSKYFSGYIQNKIKEVKAMGKLCFNKKLHRFPELNNVVSKGSTFQY